MNWFISVPDRDSKSYPQFFNEIDVFEIKTESSLRLGVNESEKTV